MSPCVFCEIVSGTSPARIVYSDDDVLGFLDIRPVTRGHTLLIPRTHSDGLSELRPELAAKIFQAGQRLATAMKRAPLTADGVNLLMNDGRAAFQTVFHSHLHVIPRYDGDKLKFAKGLVVRRDPDLEGTAQAIRSALKAA